MCGRWIPIGLGVLISLTLSGCFSRKLAVMDLHETLEAIADELCDGVESGDLPKVTLITATGMTVGADGATFGIPISASGNVSESTQIEVHLKPLPCTNDAARLVRRDQRAVYTYDTWTGELTPRNEEAKKRTSDAVERARKRRGN